MDPVELLEKTASDFERIGVPYFVTGSMASMLYGEQRLTNDVDMVVALKESHVPQLMKAFPAGEYYLDEGMAQEAIRRHHQFNIIHPTSGLKVDVIVCPDTEFNRSRFARAKRIASSDISTALFSSPEDVILKKMEYYKMGGSEKHLRDITGIMKVSAEKIDRDYVRKWSESLDLTEIWDAILKRLSL